MTAFEQYLIDNGWLKFIVTGRPGHYVRTDRHDLSTIGNLDHRYFHKDDQAVEKIERGEELNPDDTARMIIFGLHECHKPPTLIRPRGNIRIFETINGVKWREHMVTDDDMNRLLDSTDHGHLLKVLLGDAPQIIIHKESRESPALSE